MAKGLFDKDWTYLAAKDPSDVHRLHAELVSELSGVEVSPKQVQAILAMHGTIQRSEKNQERADYRGRTPQSIAKGGFTTLQHFGNEEFGYVAASTPVEKVNPAPAEAPVEEAPKPAPRRRSRKAPATAEAYA